MGQYKPRSGSECVEHSMRLSRNERRPPLRCRSGGDAGRSQEACKISLRRCRRNLPQIQEIFPLLRRRVTRQVSRVKTPKYRTIERSRKRYGPESQLPSQLEHPTDARRRNVDGADHRDPHQGLFPTEHLLLLLEEPKTALFGSNG